MDTEKIAAIRSQTAHLVDPLTVVGLLETAGWSVVWFYRNGDDPVHLMAASTVTSFVSPLGDRLLWEAWKDDVQSAIQPLVNEHPRPGGYAKIHGRVDPADVTRLHQELTTIVERR